jgi:hypothetical protein
LLTGAVLSTVALALVLGAAGYEDLLAYAAPALVLAFALVRGHYPGEDRLVRLARRPARRPLRRRSAPRPRHFLARRVMPRGGRLIAASLAVRPPPRLGAI